MNFKHLLFASSLISFSIISQAQVNCANDSTGLIPLVDLKTDYYMGEQGGLYPGGSNKPTGPHKDDGVALAKSLKPLDSLGNVDWTNGKIGVISLGASTTGEPWNHFIDLTKVDHTINPCIQFANGCYGGKGLDIMAYPDLYGWYWDYVMNRLTSDHVSPDQVEVAWFKSGSKMDTTVTWPLFPNAIADRYTECLQVILQKFPNIKLVFMSGFVYGGYADSTKEFYHVCVEPGSYWNNWAVKFLVQRQIDGDTALKYTNPGKVAPYIAWGPNEWADGVNANHYDSLYWDCEEDFLPDGGGYHLTNAGRDKEANLIMTFFKTSLLTKKWFFDGARWNSCDGVGRLASGEIQVPGPEKITTQDIALYPNPSDGNCYIGFSKPVSGYVALQVVNNLGALVYTQRINEVFPGQGVSMDLHDLAPGIYFVNINLDGELLSKELVIDK